jgi:hypothetical protein
MGGLSARVSSGKGRARIVATVICVLALASCRGSNTGYDGPFPAEVNAAIPRIERAMGVPFREPPRLETRTRAQVREFLEQRFAEDLPQEELDGVETTYKRLGLVADSLDLRSLYMSLLTEQIVGFYDPATKVLYVVEEAPEVQRSAIITHELIHALQDQYAPLDSIQESVRNDNDRALAVQAVIEGQAMYKQIEATVGGGSMAARLPGGWERVRQSIRDNRSTMPLFASAPMIMQETLIFPYLSGAEFVRRNDFASGPAVFERLPMSTEQIMHERAYGDSLDAPTRIVLPDARAGEDVIYENGLGEFEMRVMLYVHLDDHGSAFRGAAGWDGDRFRVYRSGNSDALFWASVWDTDEDADEFAEIAANAIARRYGERSLPAAERGTFVRSGRRVTISRAAVEGRPMVIVEDVPASMRGGLVSLEGIRLAEG